MSKSIIIAAAVSAVIVTTPAFAQDRGKPAGTQSTGFGGRNGSATTLRDAPRRDTATQSSGFGGRNGSATDLRDAPRRDTGDSKREIRRSGVVTREHAPRTQSTNNLKQIGLADH
ncbi:hypothetical protein U1769_18860 [Sphingomonas sp. ZT3P38]|uniref:hypothetical protein n=1 Tax=Parasphingomonas zepuensis TaxID=3096161 RepID=UPI002FC93252